MNVALREQMEHWGYYLMPPPHERGIGAGGLAIALRPEPTRAHFDPEAIHLPVWSPFSGLEEIELGAKLPDPPSGRFVVGPIMIVDRKRHQAEFFAFGGEWTAEVLPGETLYVLSSEAPVLQVTAGREELPEQLAAEVRARLSGLGALWGTARACEFNARLARLDPLALYVGAVRSILAEQETFHDIRETFPELHERLHEERRWLESTGAWDAHPASLEEMLAPIPQAH